MFILCKSEKNKITYSFFILTISDLQCLKNNLDILLIMVMAAQLCDYMKN